MLPLDRCVIIDFNKFEVNSGFIYRQKDNNGYKIIATLTENNVVIPLANTTVSINIELNGVVTVAAMTIESETQGIVSYILPEQFVATSGTLIFDISVIRVSDSIQLTSPKVKGTITVPVDKDTAIEDSEDLPILLDLISQVQAVLDQSANFMQNTVYDTNLDGKVNAADNSDNLNSQAGTYYLSRTNHTGTQTASTISDFDAEVSNNPAVVLNTAKVSFPDAPIDGKVYGRKDSTWVEDGGGDMTKAIYDPTNVNADAFSMDSMVETSTKKILTDTERTKLISIADGAEVNVQSDWNQSTITEDDYIKNKPTDITDLSTHSVTELNDVTNAGSGQIITSAERTQITTNQTDIAALDTYVKDPSYTQDVFNVSSINSTGMGFQSDLTTPVDVSASFVESQSNDLVVKGETYNSLNDNGVDYANWAIAGAGTTKGANGIHLVQDAGNEKAELSLNLVENTQYTIIHKVNSVDAGFGDLQLTNTVEQSFPLVNLAKTIGIHRTLITSRSTIVNNRIFIISAAGTNGQSIDFEMLGILEGDYTSGANANKEIGELQFGINNTLPQRIKSVGKNLFDKSKALSDSYVLETDGSILSSALYYASEFIPVKPNTDYVVSGNDNGLRYAIYNADKIYISGALSNNIAIPSNGAYIRTTIGKTLTTDKLDTYQIEEGSVVTTYEPYQSDEVYMPDVVLRSLPNGVKDEFNLQSGEHIKRIEKYTIQSTDIISYSTIGSYADLVRIDKSKLIGGIGVGNMQNSWVDIFGKTEGLSLAGGNWDKLEHIGKYTVDINNNYIDFIVAKGQYTSLADAQAKFLTDYNIQSPSLNYQLAQSIITDANIQGNLISYENGTRTYDPFIRNEFKYATGITIPSPDDGSNLKILEVEKAFEIVNDEYVEIDSSRITISANQETITITGATNGNFYTVYALLTSDESTVPESSYSLSVNSAAQIQQNQVNTTQNSNRILTLEDKVSMLVAEIDDKLLP